MLTKQDYTETGLRLSPGPGMRGCGRRWVGVAGLRNRGSGHGYDSIPLLGAEPLRPRDDNAEFENLPRLEKSFEIYHSCSDMSGIDWTRLKTQEPDSDVEDNDEVALPKPKNVADAKLRETPGR
ncbi:hypothetical protein BU15DRAFT_62777 [Melanogaster broomeanus]|nr:hypothetical protein BU15DRAFT_62777 [Melanogaster broomeanus]